MRKLFLSHASGPISMLGRAPKKKRGESQVSEKDAELAKMR